MPDPISLDAVIAVIENLSGLQQLTPDRDFYEAGLSSVQALPLLMDLEDRFGLSIPDDRFILTRTASSVAALLTDLQQ